jgi:cephalosporin-C deacetylase-like acetyl esterase
MPVRLAAVLFAFMCLGADFAKVDPKVFEKDMSRTMSEHANKRMKEANSRESTAFAAVTTKEQWEKYRDERIAKLKASLGTFPDPPKNMRIETTRKLPGDGFVIHNILYESRPEFWVSANLYLPAKPPEKMPGFLIVTAHHTAKTQSELQDMGMTWARAGSAVLVPDQPGYGERREHGFRTEKDFDKPFRAGRQDYFFRYNSNLQLSAIGDSLMGWMVWDLQRGIDVLFRQPGIDKEKIILLGSVAGGGDPAGVTAALDPRITCVAPFNFGGWQPESQVTANPDRDFDWFGDGYWESTRGLRFGARDGFAHFVITGSVAPRKLIHSHEFAWDPKTDPAWPRLQKIFGFYDAKDSLRFTHGAGTVRSSGPGNTHCTHIGPEHRKMIHAALKEWYGMPIPSEYSKRVPSEDLLCWTPEAREKLKPKKMFEVLAELRAEYTKPAVGTPWPEPWITVLGDTSPARAMPSIERSEKIEGGTMLRFALPVEAGVDVPGLLIVPEVKGDVKPPIVVMVAQQGKAAFLKERGDVLNEFLKSGIAVCLVDVRGTGELKPGSAADRGSARTSVSQTNLILGQPLIGLQLRDLRSTMRWLRTLFDLDGKRMAVWGDSFAKVNAPDMRIAIPLDLEGPAISEPVGDHLALLAGTLEKVLAIHARGGVDFSTMMRGPHFAIPHDAVVPASRQIPDVFILAAQERRDFLRRTAVVDAQNHALDKPEAPLQIAKWMIARLKK